MLFRFREFRVYGEARQFRIYIYSVSAKFPTEERFGLTNQIRRAVNSILLNIAEGSNRVTDKEFSRFLNMSLSSLEEVVACLDIAFDQKYIRNSGHKESLEKAENLGKQLVIFMKKVRHP